MKLIISLFCFVACLVLFYFYSENQTFPFLGFEKSPTGASNAIPIFEVTATAVALLLGIFSGRLHDRLDNSSNEIVSLSEELKIIIKSPALVRSLLVSPMVFSIVYLAIKEQPDKIISLIFAFQNGFFCDKVFGMKVLNRSPDIAENISNEKDG